MLLRNRIARAGAAGTLVLAAPLLTSCGMNFATDQVYTPANAANERDSSVDVLNAAIVATEDGAGTLVTTLVNNETAALDGGRLSDVTDELTGIEGVDGDVEFTLEETVEIPGDGVAKLADGDGVPVEGEGVALGQFVEIEMTFANADPVTLMVPVVANNGAYAGQDGPELTPTTREEIGDLHGGEGEE
jgi:hypothetical protein